MKTSLLAMGLVVVTACVIWQHPGAQAHSAPAGKAAPPAIQSPAQRPRVEVVFALDTTGSMAGLIATAKEKIWSIAATMAAAQPAPELRIGLVAYRDLGDDYVTRSIDLSTDLDQMYAALMDFEAGGGGDGPESVNAALDEALHGMSWSHDRQAYQVIFLVGDAPPHEDYGNETQYPDIARAARQRGIVINTIRCGSNPATAAAWRQIAQLSAGAFFSVGQDGGALAIATPYDETLAELSRELDGTRLAYGDDEQIAAAQRKLAATEKLHAEASTAARARRAAFNGSAAGHANQFGDDDLLTELDQGRVALKHLDETELPAPLQALPAQQREDFLGQVRTRREGLTRRMQELTRERDAYLADAAQGAPDAQASLDYQVFEAVRDQAQDKGLEYSGPKL